MLVKNLASPSVKVKWEGSSLRKRLNAAIRLTPFQNNTAGQKKNANATKMKKILNNVVFLPFTIADIIKLIYHKSVNKFL